MCYLLEMAIQRVHPGDNGQPGHRISLEALSKVVGFLVGSRLHYQLQVVRYCGRVFLQTILARPVRIAGEKDDTAAVRAEAAEKSEDQSRVSDMAHLKLFSYPSCVISMGPAKFQ